MRRHLARATCAALSTLAISAASLSSRAVAQPAQNRAPANAPGSPAPRLVVFIMVDQLQEPYFDRYGGEFTGGFRRLLDRGAFFDEAYHDHAVTETAVGHATVLSGRFPASMGILTNALGVGDTTSRVIGAANANSGASPYRFRGSVLMDWLRIADSRSRGLSVSVKDRSAILPLGRSQQPAFWYGGSSGMFTTSRHYADTLPTWVQSFNARRLPQSMAGRSWTLLHDAARYSEPDSVPIESAGRTFTFPHVMSSTPATAAGQLPDYPFMDEVLMNLALEGMRARELGSDDITDLLAVSFSATDAIGHRYGPDSREIHDQLLRLDQVLGQFIDSVYARVDSTRVIFALSADHGITPFPELHMTAAEAAAAHVNTRPALAAFRAAVKSHGIDSADVSFSSGMLTVKPTALSRSGYTPTAETARFVTALRALSGIAFASTVTALPRTDTIRNTHARRWIHMLPRDAAVLAVASVKPGHVWGASTSANHGTSSDTDAHVPIFFYGAPFKPGRYSTPVRTVDIAPTLAHVIGVSPTERLDGRVLRQAVR